MNRSHYADETLPEPLQQTLNHLAQVNNRKDELISALSSEQPTKSRLVESNYLACTWWEGCYYCIDAERQWHRIKCFT